MSGVANKLMSAAGGAGGGFTAIEDVFSTYLYTGNDSTQTITNGIDLAGEGGLVWLKSRNIGYSHFLFDTERGASSTLGTNSGGAAYTTSRLSSFDGDGFTLGVDAFSNNAAYNYASWTFRKAPRFFDVVTYTGTGAARTVDHNLGTTVGSIIIKRTDTTSNWAVYHRGNTAAPETDFLSLNLTNATADDATYWNDTAPTDSVFTVGTNAAVNASGGTYVAYLYAHDPLGPSEDGSDGLIACGSYTGNGSATGPVINLGWEPQWLLIKGASTSGLWELYDSMRGLTVAGVNDARLIPNDSGAEGFGSLLEPRSTGFQITNNGADRNGSGQTYIYIAIRRGPMRAPTSGTEVFTPVAYAGSSSAQSISTGLAGDLYFGGARSSAGQSILLVDKLRGSRNLIYTPSDLGEETLFAEGITFTNVSISLGTSVPNRGLYNNNGINHFAEVFRRAPEFFDVVAYTGNGVSLREVSHNLKVSPELLIIKNRSITTDWWVDFYPDETQRLNLRLNLTNAASGPFTSLLPTPSTIVLGNTSLQNQSGNNYIAYLFSTLAGVSKVGSYTGNGSSQTINCGFTTGARFILIKRTDAAGDWYVWDTARGIVAANDPHLSLNTTAAEVTTDDSVDPDSSGFIVNQVAATKINVSAASYIFYAVA